MKYLLLFFLASLMAGQLGALPLYPGVVLYLHDIALIPILVYGSIRVMRSKKTISPGLFAPLLLFIFTGFLSLIMNIRNFSYLQLSVSSLYLLRYIAYAGVYFVLAQGFVSSEFLLHGLFWSGIVFSFLGFIQYIWYPALRNLSYLGWDEHYMRLFSTIFDPNYAGILLVLTFFVGMYLWPKTKNTLMFTMLVSLIVGLFLTFSRSSYLAFIIGFFVYTFFNKQWKSLYLLAILVTVVIFIPKPGGQTLLLTRYASAAARIGNWQESKRIIAGAPVFGHGFNTLRYVPRSQQISQSEIFSRSLSGLDSSLLFVLATTGMTGFVSYTWLLFRQLRLLWLSKNMRNTGSALFIALLLHSCFVNSLFYPWVMIWIWIFFAAAENMKKNVISGT